MPFAPKKTPGIGELILIDIEQNETVRGEFDKLFEDVEGLSRIFCAVFAELSDVYRIWDIYGLPYTTDIIHLPGVETRRTRRVIGSLDRSSDVKNSQAHR